MEPEQPSSVAWTGIGLQSPVVVRLQAKHVPAQAPWQHTPSTQNPETHSSPLPVQVFPFAILQAPAPSQAFPPEHAPDGK